MLSSVSIVDTQISQSFLEPSDILWCLLDLLFHCLLSLLDFQSTSHSIASVKFVYKEVSLLWEVQELLLHQVDLRLKLVQFDIGWEVKRLMCQCVDGLLYDLGCFYINCLRLGNNSLGWETNWSLILRHLLLVILKVSWLQLLWSKVGRGAFILFVVFQCGLEDISNSILLVSMQTATPAIMFSASRFLNLL